MGGSGRLIPGDIRTLLIPGDDLGLQGPTGQPLKLGQDIDLTLAVLTAQGPNGPKLVQVDDDGFLIVNNSPATSIVTNKIFNGTLATATIYTVPAEKQWNVLYGCIQLDTTATLLARQIIIEVLDAAGRKLWNVNSANTQNPSLSDLYELTNSLALSGTLVGGFSRFGMPIPTVFILPAGATVRLTDGFARDPADVVTANLIVTESDI